MKNKLLILLVFMLVGCDRPAISQAVPPSSLVQVHGAAAADNPEHAHNHGAAQLNLVLDVSSLTLQVQIPAFDAVGFEQQPQTDAQEAALTQVLTRFKTPDILFSLPAKAGCTLTQGEVTTALLNAASSTIEHADFAAHYQWHCAKPQALKTLQIHLFGQFPHLQKINSQYVVNTKQGGRILTPSDNQLVFE